MRDFDSDIHDTCFRNLRYVATEDMMFERIGGFLDNFLAIGLLIIFALPIAAIGLIIIFVQQIYDKVLGKENPPDGGPDPKQ